MGRGWGWGDAGKRGAAGPAHPELVEGRNLVPLDPLALRPMLLQRLFPRRREVRVSPLPQIGRGMVNPRILGRSTNLTGSLQRAQEGNHPARRFLLPLPLWEKVGVR